MGSLLFKQCSDEIIGCTFVEKSLKLSSCLSVCSAFLSWIRYHYGHVLRLHFQLSKCIWQPASYDRHIYYIFLAPNKSRMYMYLVTSLAVVTGVILIHYMSVSETFCWTRSYYGNYRHMCQWNVPSKILIKTWNQQSFLFGASFR